MEEENRTTPNTELYITCDKDEYFKCSMYYLRRYLGLREIILLAILLGVGLALFFWLGNIFILILFAISVLLISVAIVLFLITSKSGYTVDMERKGVYRQKLEFTEDALLVTSMDKSGTPIFIETHPYDRIDTVSIKKDRVYIYAQTSVFYYVFAKHYDEKTCEDLVVILKKKLRPEAFKFRHRIRALPKRKKVTLESDE